MICYYVTSDTVYKGWLIQRDVDNVLKILSIPVVPLLETTEEQIFVTNVTLVRASNRRRILKEVRCDDDRSVIISTEMTERVFTDGQVLVSGYGYRLFTAKHNFKVKFIGSKEYLYFAVIDGRVERIQ